MALTNYTTLKASIANWLNRSDLTDEIADDFIVLTEADFNSKLRVRKMVTQATVTVNAETASLPTDFLQVRDFYILSGSTKYPLRYMTPSQMDQTKGTSTTGIPQAYTILGDTFRFMPKPDATYTGYVNYYKKFTALSDSNTTNFILTNHPAIYLYGSLFHAANFLGGYNPQQVQTWQQMYATALERLELNDREDQFSGSPLQIRSEDTIASPFKSNYTSTTNSA
ncbi:conserved protein of unknown function [uncultured Mediterranean phage uvMED]|jgi:hypothetical protein|nr:conserved protein of unknown function [uncultured Mediterranean phage uvMED]|tara:strand:+ start:498 stop:1172 length:675 start_codon:yes stop_codon:yes gene_type:complete